MVSRRQNNARRTRKDEAQGVSESNFDHLISSVALIETSFLK